MASIETVVQNADVEMADDSKPDSTAEVKEEPGENHSTIEAYLRGVSRSDSHTVYFS